MLCAVHVCALLCMYGVLCTCGECACDAHVHVAHSHLYVVHAPTRVWGAHVCTCVTDPGAWREGAKTGQAHTHIPLGVSASVSTGTRGPLPLRHATCCHRRIAVTDVCPLSRGFVPGCSRKCQTLSFCGRGLYCSQTLMVRAGPSPDGAWLRKSSLH